MKFNGKLTAHGNGHKVLVPKTVVETEGLKDGDSVMVDVTKTRRETSCKRCIHKKDCWVRSAMLMKGFNGDLTEREMRIVVRASNGDCDLYDEAES